MDNELKPCPFCGKTKFKIDSKKSTSCNWSSEKQKMEYLHVVTVRCNCCHTRGPTVSVYLENGHYNVTELLQSEAADVWNRRA